MGDSFEIRADSEDFGKVLKAIKGFDKNLSTAIRKRLRDAAKPALEHARKVVLQPPPAHAEGRTRHGHNKRTVTRKKASVEVDAHTREAIAKGMGVRIVTRDGRTGGVAFAARDSYLAGPRKPMVKAYNSKTWRHPVFGGKRVDQVGNPYFGNVLVTHREAFKKAVEAALEDARKALEAGNDLGAS